MIRMGESGLGTLLIDVQIDIDTRENTTVATSEANKVPPHGQAVFLLDTHSREESHHLLCGIGAPWSRQFNKSKDT